MTADATAEVEASTLQERLRAIGRDLTQSWEEPRIVLRAARVEELPAMVELFYSSRREKGQAATPEMVQGSVVAYEHALACGELVLLLEREGAVAGLFMGALYAGAGGALEYYIANIALDADLRSQGLGTRLMQHAEHCLRRAGVKRITLDYMAYNAGVAPFYERLGFRTLGYDLRAVLGPPGALGTEPPTPGAPRAAGSPALARAGAHDTRVRSYELADAGALCAYFYQRQALRDFERPYWSEAEIARELARLAESDRDRVFLVLAGDELRGVCWAEHKVSKAGLPIVVTHCFESADEAGAELLHDALARYAAEGSTLESYVTLWEPSAGALALALARGFAIGRYKLQKDLQTQSDFTQR